MILQHDTLSDRVRHLDAIERRSHVTAAFEKAGAPGPPNAEDVAVGGGLDLLDDIGKPSDGADRLGRATDDTGDSRACEGCLELERRHTGEVLAEELCALEARITMSQERRRADVAEVLAPE